MALAASLWSLQAHRPQEEHLEARPGRGQWAGRQRLAAATLGAAAYALVRDGLLKLWWLILLAHSLNGRGIARSTAASPRKTLLRRLLS
jgi:hypothetical protein